MPTLKACLNGDRDAAAHPGVPVTPQRLAEDAAAVRAAGADAVHLHPRDRAGAESLAWPDVAAAVAAVRAGCPGLPVGVSTRQEIVPDLPDRLRLLARWSGPPIGPDFASVNWHEPGATEVAALLAERGIGVEAGLFTPDAADGARRRHADRGAGPPAVVSGADPGGRRAPRRSPRG
ncbi:3-keto-5-aminohexanoate cleavage protein [Micromonospora zhanjiangensis]|uniref:3-keto-5-aminohexanoate cleavage protein n=1 Tax=Micromonospora zhanjiangensis TaxID=1522057 RepID=A0ABV8KMU8_9ACTN